MIGLREGSRPETLLEGRKLRKWCFTKLLNGVIETVPLARASSFSLIF